MHTTITQRLSESINWLKESRDILSQAELAERIGIHASQISEMLNGKRSISERTIHIIGKEFPELSTDWLLTGEGEMLNIPEDTAVAVSTAADYRLVPLYNMDAHGGFGTNSSIDVEEFVVDLIPFKDAQDGDLCVPVTGNSMVPTYYPGTIVLLRIVSNWREFIEYGNVYMIVLDDGRRLLKEIKRSESDKTTHYLLSSHNKAYDPVELPKSIIHSIFLVTAVYHKTTM